ncbi:MAG: hypothetical protein P8X57_09010, partial [Cyclobacteriaceae bacterium]
FRATADPDASVEIVGTWSFTADMSDGETNGTLVLEGSDGAYTGSLTTDNGLYELRDITLSGNVLKFLFDVEADGQNLVFKSDVIVEGGRYKGRLHVSTSESSSPLASFDLYGAAK